MDREILAVVVLLVTQVAIFLRLRLLKGQDLRKDLRSIFILVAQMLLLISFVAGIMSEIGTFFIATIIFGVAASLITLPDLKRALVKKES